VRSPKKVVLDLKYVDQELENEYLLQSALILAQIKGNDTVTRVLQRVSRESADSSIHLKKNWCSNLSLLSILESGCKTLE